MPRLVTPQPKLPAQGYYNCRPKARVWPAEKGQKGHMRGVEDYLEEIKREAIVSTIAGITRRRRLCAGVSEGAPKGRRSVRETAKSP